MKRLVKDLPYMCVLFICWYVVAHLSMLPGYEPDSITTWLGVWTFVPLSGFVVTLWHVLVEDEFSPLLIGEAVLAMLTYLLRMEAGSVLVLSLSVVVMVLMEAFTLLRRFEGPQQPGQKPGFLAGLAADRKYLAVLFFWTVALPAVIQISCFCLPIWAYAVGFLLPVLLLVGLILPFTHMKSGPLTAGGAAGVLVIFFLSLAACFAPHFPAGSLYVMGAFALLALMEGIIWLLRRGSQKQGETKDI